MLQPSKSVVIFLLMSLQSIFVRSLRDGSLTFVIDDTGSMEYEINFVKDAVEDIMKIIHQSTSQISDVVLVTFNDYGRRKPVELREKTTDSHKLYKALKDIKVSGGLGDCAELALTGLKKALEKSDENSNIFLFTDASAKDYQFTDEVIRLAQQKGSQVTFVMTPHKYKKYFWGCPNGGFDHKREDKAEYFDEIATATNGKVFRLDNVEQMSMVLDYVKMICSGNTVPLSVSNQLPRNRWSRVSFTVDEDTEYIEVSAFGIKVHAEGIDSLPGIAKAVVWTNNIKIWKIMDIKKGNYSIWAKGNDINVAIFARSDFSFQYGFTEYPDTPFEHTKRQPTIGTGYYLVLSVRAENDVIMKSVDILTKYPPVFIKLKLNKVTDNIYATDKFLPPESMFSVAVNGIQKHTNRHVRKISRTPISPDVVYIRPLITVYNDMVMVRKGEPLHLKVKVHGYPRPLITWFFRSNSSSKFLPIEGTGENLHVNEKTQLSDTGEYKCVASNKKKTDEKIIQVVVTEPPKIIRISAENSSVEEVPYNMKVVLSCEVKSSPEPMIVWKDITGHTIVSVDEKINKLSPFIYQSILVIDKVKNSDKYECIATNEEGTVTDYIEVKVRDPFELKHPDGKVVEVEYKKDALLKCEIESHLPFTIDWYRVLNKTYEAIKITAGFNVSPSGLKINKVVPELEGEYVCVATLRENLTINRSYHTFVHIKNVDIVMTLLKEKLTVREGEPLNIRVKVQGYPPPSTKWFFRPQSSDPFVAVPGNDSFHLDKTELSNSGEYKCVATNERESAEKVVQVLVTAPTKIKISAENSNVEDVALNSKLVLSCEVRTNSEPMIFWNHIDGTIGNINKLAPFIYQKKLVIEKVKKSDKYVCIAANKEGIATDYIEVKIRNPFELKKPNGEVVEVEYEKDALLKCEIESNLPFTIDWYRVLNKKYEAIKTTTGFNVSPSGLKINKVVPELEGEYVCVATLPENLTINRSYHTFVRIKNVGLVMTLPDETLTVKEGEPLNIRVKVQGYPPPTTKWFFRSQPSDPFAVVPGNDSFHLDKTELSNSGEYKCVATNEKESVEKIVQVLVTAPPQIIISTEYSNVEDVPYNSKLVLMCDVRSSPEPRIIWKDMDEQTIANVTITELAPFHYQSKLILDKVKKTEKYMCIATNEEGSANDYIGVKIRDPFVVKPPNKKVINVGYEKDALLKCEIESYLPVKIEWFRLVENKNGKQYISIKNSSDFAITSDKLKINKVVPDLEGKYTCVATLRDDKKVREAYDIILQINDMVPPKIEAADTIFNATHGDTVLRVPCKVIANPKAAVSWTMNGTDIENGEKYNITDVGLTIMYPHGKDTANYTCSGVSKLGKAEKTFQVFVDSIESR